jgi:hypothetical protein
MGARANHMSRQFLGPAKWIFGALTVVALLWLLTVSPVAAVGTTMAVASIVLTASRMTRALKFTERRFARTLSEELRKGHQPQSAAKSAVGSTSSTKNSSEVRRALNLLTNGYASTARPVLERHIARSRPGDAGVNVCALALATFDVGSGDFSTGAAWSHTAMLCASTPQDYLAGVLLLADALTFSGRPSDARNVLDLAPEKSGIEWAIRLANTHFTEGEEAAGLAVYNDRWLAAGAQAVRLIPGDAPLIERLRPTEQSRVDGPTVSCLVPVYNAANTIGYALRSLREQTYANLEIVVVDDGSDDDTIAAIESASEGDDRFRLITSADNAGAYVARNTALRAATGDWIRVLDADDWLHPSAIALQAMDVSTHPRVPWSWHRGFRCDPSLRAIPNESLGFYRHRRLRDMYSSVLYRRRDISSGWPTWPVSADSALMRDVKRRLGSGPRQTHPNSPLGFFLDHPGSLMGASGPTSSLGLRHPAGLRRLTVAFQNAGAAADDGPDQSSMNLLERVALGGREPSLALNVVYAAPFHPLGSQTGVLADEISTIADSRTIGVLNLPIAAHPDFLGLSASTVGALRNRQDVKIVLAGQSVTCDAVIVRHAASAMALPDWQATIQATKVVVVVERTDLSIAPPIADSVGAWVRGIVDGARRLCSDAEVVLVPSSIDVREQILASTTRSERGGALVSPVDWPFVLERLASEAPRPETRDSYASLVRRNTAIWDI